MSDVAILFTAPEQAELRPLPDDDRPLGPQEVAGRTLASLVSPGTELAWGYTAADGFPKRTGYAAVFEVEAVGDEVTTFAPGDRALCLGHHQSRQRVGADRAAKVPAGLPPERATFARLMGVSMSTLTTTAARPPEPVLVTGLGPVGHLAAAVFCACGYDVTALDPVAARREWARAAGVPRVAASLDEVPEQAGGFALAIECSGHEAAVLAGCNAVRKGGEVVLVGVPWKRRTELTAFDLLHPVFHRYVTLRSGWEWELPMLPTDFRSSSIFGNYTGALRWLAEGRVRVDDLFRTAPPADAQRVYQSLLHGDWPALGAVFDWAAA